MLVNGEGKIKMGTDIHVYIEARNNKTNKWERVNVYKKTEDNTFEPVDVYPYRSYNLFSLLAGVRGWHEPFVSPRGLPADLSEEVMAEWKKYENEWHTPSYYDITELVAYLRSLPPDNEEEDDYSHSNMSTFVHNIEQVLDWNGYYGNYNPGHVRVVFWFDS